MHGDETVLTCKRTINRINAPNKAHSRVLRDRLYRHLAGQTGVKASRVGVLPR